MGSVQRIRFQGQEYVLTSGGAIATAEDLANFQPSFAHLYADGTIMRHHQQIGTREDIEVLGECEVEPTLGGLAYGVLQGLKTLDALIEGKPLPPWERHP
mgnify:CR=1 FL=1